MNLFIKLNKIYTKINKHDIYIRNYYCINWLEKQENNKNDKNNYKNLNSNEKIFYKQLENIEKQNKKIIFLLEKQNTIIKKK